MSANLFIGNHAREGTFKDVGKVIPSTNFYTNPLSQHQRHLRRLAHKNVHLQCLQCLLRFTYSFEIEFEVWRGCLHKKNSLVPPGNV